MGNFLGAKHTLGMTPQTTPGTPETTVDTFFLTESISMYANPKNIDRKTHAGSGRLLPPRVGTISPKGKAKMEVAASQPHPWYWLLGAVDTTTVHTGVYLHEITDNGAGINLSAEGDRVFDQASQGDVQIDKLVLSAQPGEIAQLDMEWLALSHVDGATLTSVPAFVTDPLTTRNTIVTIGGTQSIIVDSVDLTIESGSVQTPVLIDNDGAPALIRRAKPMEITGKIKFIDYPTAELAKLTAATSFAMILQLDGDIIAETHQKFLRITLPACQYTGGLDPEIGADLVTGEAEFKAYYDTTSESQITVEAQNGIATIS